MGGGNCPFTSTRGKVLACILQGKRGGPDTVTGTSLLFNFLGSSIRSSSLEVWIKARVSYTMEICATMS